MNKFKSKVIDFYCSDWFLSLLVILILAFWVTGWEIAGTIVIVSLMCLYLWIGSDLRPVASVILMITMMYSLEQIKTHTFIVVVYCLVPVIILSFVYNIIRFKRVRVYTKGKLYYPMAIALVAALCSGICFDLYNKMWTFVVLGVGVGIYFLYFLCRCCVGEGKKELFCKILFFAGMIVCVQIFVWLLRNPTYLKTLSAREQLRVGWGMKNTLPLVLAMAAPAVVYLGLNQKAYSYLMFPVLALFTIVLVLTLSRGNILFGGPVIALSCLIAFVKGNSKVKITAVVIVAACVAGLLLCAPLVRLTWEKLMHGHADGFLDDNGRDPLYEQAMQNFFNNPIFGVGFFKYEGAHAGDGPAVKFLWKTHNTLMQVLSCGGIVGVIGLFPYFVGRYRLLLTDLTLFKLLALHSLVAYELEGMVDISFLSVHQLFFLIGLFAAAELEGCEKQAIVSPQKRVKVVLMQKVRLRS